MLEDIRNAAARKVGLKSVIHAVEAGQVTQVVLASDADEAYRSRVFSICQQYDVPLTTFGSMQEIGKACGIEVGAAVVALLEA